MEQTAYPSFLLPPKFSVKRLTESLGAAFPINVEDEQHIERRFLDTFDWRLWLSNLVLFEMRNGRERSLVTQDLSEGETLASIRITRSPSWPHQIPEGELRERVAGLVAMRVLLPLVKVLSKARVLRVLNEDDKTVVRLRVEQIACDAEDLADARKLLPRLRVLPVRGYPAEFDAVVRFVCDELGFPEAPRGLLDEALVAVGREPGDYSSKLNIPLKPVMRADMAARRIFLHLLGTLERNVEGTKADLDSEFLHDLRVATRRTRSALTQIKGVLPQEVLDDFRERFGWLGQVTGPTRDMDVFLLEFPRYQVGLPPDLREDIVPLHAYLEAHQRKEQLALRRKLNSAQFKKLLTAWREYLESALPSAPAAPNALRRAKEVADERIWRMYRRVIKEGRAINDGSPAEDLHELRKSCKKLRYLIEFFQSLYPDDALKPMIKTLKVLLDNLGEFQDLHVQAEELMGFAGDMQAEGKVELRTLLSIGALIGDLLRAQQLARTQFAERFAGFDTKDNRAAYRKLFKAAGT